MNVKALTLDGLEYFKGKQDSYNDGKFATKTQIPTKVSQLTNDSDYQTKTQITSAINAAIASVMTYKGVKETIGELPQDGNKLGDVWHVSADSVEYAWDGTKWEALGGMLQSSVSWDDITSKPLTFTPSEHTHDNATTDNAGFMSKDDKAKLDGIEAGANKYTHPTSSAGAKEIGLYKVATDANGHVTEATAVEKDDITALGVKPIPDGGTEGQFIQSKSGDAAWADGMYLSDDKIMSGATEVSGVSVNSGGSKVEVSAGEDSAIQITDVTGKVLPIGITGGESAVGLGQSPIDYIYVKDIADLTSVDGKLVPNSGSVKKYVDSKTVVDSDLSDSSVNPVQNKVIKAALDGINSAVAITNEEIDGLF